MLKRILLVACLLTASVARAQFPTRDIYGGLVAAPSPNGATGYFHTERMNGGTGHWAIVDPLGNYTWLSCMYAVTYADGGANYAAALAAKYVSHSQWATFQLNRLQQYGYNCIGAFSASGSYNVFPVASFGTPAATPKIPFVWKVGGADLCIRQTSTDPLYPTAVKNIIAGIRSAVVPSYAVGKAFTDVFDPAFLTCVGDLANASGGSYYGFTGGISPTEPYLVAIQTDEADELLGVHVGLPLIGWFAAVTNPYQSGPLTFAFTDPNVYSKQNFATFLQAKYGAGAPGLTALNAAWGSTYTTWGSSGFAWTGANADTGLATGTNTTATYTSVHLSHPGITASSFNLYETAQSTYTSTVSDNFNRSNGGLGANWTTFGTMGAPQIATNEVVTASSTYVGAYYSGTAVANDQYAEITAEASSLSTGALNIILFVRATTSGKSYAASCNGKSNSGIGKYTNTAFTQFTSYTCTFVPGDVLHLEVVGSSIVFFKNNVQVSAYTDTTYTTGAPGFSLGGSTGVAADNFAGGTAANLGSLKIGQDDGSGNLTNTGCVGTPCVSSGTVDYANGRFTVTLASNLPTNEQLSAGYTGNAWPKITTTGTGLMDEDGSSSWVPNNALTGGSATMRTDLENYTFSMMDEYYTVYRTGISAVFPHHMILGFGALNSNADPAVFAASEKDLDLIEINALLPGPQDATTICDNGVAWGNYTCKPELIYGSLSGYPDSEMTSGWGTTPQSSCNIIGATTSADYTLQTLRGTCYVQYTNWLWNATAMNGDRPVVGFDWWEWVDKTAQAGNFGFISSRDNPYGFGLDASSGGCTETQGSVTVTDCSELLNHGDFLTSVIAGQTTMFNNLIQSNAVPPTAPPRAGLLLMAKKK